MSAVSEKKEKASTTKRIQNIYEIAGLSILRPEQENIPKVKKTIPSPKKRNLKPTLKREASPPKWDPTDHKYNRYGMLLKPGEVDEEGYADTPQHIIQARRKAAPVREYLARTCHNENIDLMSQADTLAGFERTVPHLFSLWNSFDYLYNQDSFSEIEDGEIN